MKPEIRSKCSLISSMVIFGTIGLFVRSIPYASSLIALIRGIIGVAFLCLIMHIQKRKPCRQSIRKNFIKLSLSGVFIGFNWILLFEAYRYTSVATATLCYYLAPIFVLLAAPFILQQKLTIKKIACVLLALVGMFFISGVIGEGVSSSSELLGIVLGIGAAILYASVILINQKIDAIGAYDKTIVQLGSAAIVLFPYCLLTSAFTNLSFSLLAIVLLLIVGIIHTGLAYYLYFSSMTALQPQTIAIFSYVDPIVAVFLSALVLNEAMGPFEIIGAVLILGAAFFSELPEKS